jgi:hypothetical protein
MSGSSLRYLRLAEYAERLFAARRDPRGWIDENLHIRSKDRRIIPFMLRASNKTVLVGSSSR